MGTYNSFVERDLQAAYKSERMGFGYDYEGQVHLGITGNNRITKSAGELE